MNQPEKTASTTLVSPSTTTMPEIDYIGVIKAAKVLRALNHKLRQQLIVTIFNNPGITVTEIYVKLRLEQSVASQHLGILRRANIISAKRDGKFIFYSINFGKIEQINTYTKGLVEYK